MRKTVRMKRFLSMYQIAPIVKGEYGKNSYASSWSKMQLRLFIAKEVTSLEAQILAKLDQIVYRAGGIGRENPLAVWVCLWMLILTYRSHFPFLHWNHKHDIECRFYPHYARNFTTE
jgi:hypothetical protein